MSDLALPSPPGHIHFMGLGGIGVSGLARILLGQGYRVSGCDLLLGRLTDGLVGLGATAYQGHDPSHLDAVDLLVISSAVRPDNAELRSAVARGLPILKRAEVLAGLLSGRRTIAVAGTHGKTTTSALVATILVEVGLDPTAFIGGEAFGLDGHSAATNARAGAGEWAVAEADEYDASFLRLTPQVAIVTNVEADHLDFYGDLDGVRRAFAAFVGRLPAHGTLVVCGDDPGAADLRAHAGCKVITYGLGGSPDWLAEDLHLTAEGAAFVVRTPAGSRIAVTTRLAARHNVLNSLAALAACRAAGVAPERAAETLSHFRAPRRRMEVKGRSAHGALVLDDYGHHPTEVRSTLAGLRLRYPGLRIRVAYQPHTYSRTRAFLAETGASFDDADDVAIADIYAARESDTLGITAADVVEAVRRAGRPVTHAPVLDDVARWLAGDDGPDVILVTMGAGDIWKAGERLVSGAPAGAASTGGDSGAG